MKKLLLAGSMIAAILILNSSVSQAQVTAYGDGAAIPQGPSGSPSAIGNVTTEITPILDLANNAGSTAVDFNFANIALLDAGIEHDGAVTLTYRTNQPWTVNVSANTANFGGGDATSPMPAGVLQYRLGNTSTFIPMSTVAQAVTGTQLTRGAGTIGVDYLMNPRYNYGPGSYTLTVTYTISND